MYYVSTSWDPTGHSPTQQQIDLGIENLRLSPSSHSYNIVCWQPHLENKDLVPRIWKWLEHYCKCKVDYSSMPLADKQIWWLIAPESIASEQDELLTTHEEILTRSIIEKQILDPDTLYDIKRDNFDIHGGDTRHCLVRGILPRIYMQLQSMMDFMQKEYGYFPVIFNRPTQDALTFNREFGEYFNGVPVLPIVFATFFSKPRIVKHSVTKRAMNSNHSGSLVQFAPYQVFETAPGQKELPNSHWWVDGKLGPALTVEEKQQEYKLQTHDFDESKPVVFSKAKNLI